MIFIEAQRTLAGMGEEAAQGTLLPVPAASTSKGGKGRKGK
jgi:hypothetical protein